MYFFFIKFKIHFKNSIYLSEHFIMKLNKIYNMDENSVKWNFILVINMLTIVSLNLKINYPHLQSK